MLGHNKVILITGISSGFGKVMAEELARQGHKVYGTSRRTIGIEGVTHIVADSADSGQVAAAVKQVMDNEKQIDVFINNAGMGIGGPLEFCTIEDARLQMDVNFFGMLHYLHHIVPIMRQQRRGMIMAISSIGGVMGLPYQGLYSASKFAIEGYCETLRLELRPFGINVVVVRPGDFATGFTAQRKSINVECAQAYSSYKDSLASIESDEQGGLKPDYLARRIAKIVKIGKPANTYVIASTTQALSVTLKRFLPEKWFANILAHYYKM